MAKIKKNPKGKGNYGYIARQKKKRLGIAVFMLAIPLVIYFTGRIYFGSTKNVFSIIAALGAIPAAKFIVDFIMIMMQKSAPEEIYTLTEKYAGDLPRGYELVVSAYEGTLPLDAVVICGNNVMAYSTYGSRDRFEFTEKHIARILTGNGYGNVNVRIFSEKKAYTDRIAQLALSPEIHRAGLKEFPDDRYPHMNRETCILHIIMAISL